MSVTKSADHEKFLIKTINDRYMKDVAFEIALDKACLGTDWPSADTVLWHNCSTNLILKMGLAASINLVELQLPSY